MKMMLFICVMGAMSFAGSPTTASADDLPQTASERAGRLPSAADPPATGQPRADAAIMSLERKRAGRGQSETKAPAGKPLRSIAEPKTQAPDRGQ